MAFSQVSCQISEPVARDPGPHHDGGPSWACCTCLRVLAAVAVRGLDGGAELVERGHAEHPAVVVHGDRLPGRGQHGGVQRGAQRVGADGEGVADRLGPHLPEGGAAGQRGEGGRVDPAAGALRLGDADPRPAGGEGLRDGRVRGQDRARVQGQARRGHERQPPDAPVEADEARHVVVDGRGEELLRRGELGELAVRAEQRHQVADLDGLLDVVGDEHDRLSQLGLQRQQLVLQGGADHRVDGAERLVHQQDGRVGGEGAGDADALLLAAGQLVRVALRQGRVEADEGEQFPGPCPRLLARPAVEHGDRGDVVLDGAVREQPGLLDHVADAPAQLRGVALLDVGAVEQDGALRRLHEAVDHPQGGGLAAAARADEDHRLPRGDLQVEPVDGHRPVRVPLRHCLERDQAAASCIRIKHSFPAIFI